MTRSVAIQPTVSFSQEGASMFKELGPLLGKKGRCRGSYASGGRHHPRQRHSPQASNESENDALTPLRSAWLARRKRWTAELPSALVRFWVKASRAEKHA